MYSLRREAVVDDAGGGVVRAADKAEAVGQQRQAGHRPVWCLKVRRTAPSLTLKSLTVLSIRAGERVLVVGQRHEGRHPVGVQLEGVLEGAVEEPHADGLVVPEPLRMRWPSGIAATINGSSVPAARRCSPRLLVATLHTLTSLIKRAADDVLAVDASPPRAHAERRCAPRRCGRACRRRGTAGPRTLLSFADHKVHAVGQRRDARMTSLRSPTRRRARRYRRASTDAGGCVVARRR